MLFANGQQNVWIYTPDGAPEVDWKPTTTDCDTRLNPGTTYTLKGTQLNGLSQGAYYGDDATMATNYPIVRLDDATNHRALYCRTHDHSTMRVATGSTIVTTNFDVPAICPPGDYQLRVIANGIASEPHTVTVVSASAVSRTAAAAGAAAGAGGDGATPVAATLSSTAFRYAFMLIPLVGLAYGLIRIWAGKDGDHAGRAVVLSSAVLFAIFLLLELARPGAEDPGSAQGTGYGWTTLLFGFDGRMSTSKAQVFLWTYGLAYASLFLAGVAVFVHPHRMIFTDTNWQDYLVLLGGPFAAAVLAKYAVTTSVNNGVLDKSPTATANPLTGATPADGQQASPSDLVQNDNGSLDLVDTQYFIFNIVAFTYAAAVFISHNFNHRVLVGEGKYTLPTIPAVLLALTSASAATYVGNKAIQKNAPRITEIDPDTNVHADDLLSIKGVSLVPAGTPAGVAADQTTVWFSNANTSVQRTPSVATATLVQCKMPPSFEGTTVKVVVVSSGAIATPIYQIAVASQH